MSIHARMLFIALITAAIALAVILATVAVATAQ